MNIKQLIKDCYQAAIDRGEYVCQVCKGMGGTEFQGLDADSTECDPCDGIGINPNININEKIAFINLELYKALYCYQKDRFWYGKTCGKENEGYRYYEHYLAGVFIKIFELAGYTKFNLHLHQSESYRDNWGNVAEDLKLINYEVNSKDFSFVISLLNGFCFHHKIDIETHIKLRMEHKK